MEEGRGKGRFTFILNRATRKTPIGVNPLVDTYKNSNGHHMIQIYQRQLVDCSWHQTMVTPMIMVTSV